MGKVLVLYDSASGNTAQNVAYESNLAIPPWFDMPEN